MDRAAETRTADRHAEFALALLDACPAGAADNVVLSPWSISSALAVLAPACDPPTRTELEGALAGGAGGGGSSVEQDVVAGLAGDAATIAGERPWSAEAVLAVANTLWVDEGRTPVPEFIATLDRWPGAALRFAPISSDPEEARRAVNADVAATTRQLIPQILPEGALTSDDRTVLANALYLYVPWLEPFAASRTEDAPFHGPGAPRAVPTMRTAQELPYAREGWEYVGLPLDLGFRAEVLLPPAGRDSGDAVPDAATLLALRRRAEDHRVDLHLPRLRAERATSLREPLEQLGVRRIFSDLSVNLVVEEPLWIAVASHAAVLRMDETGIEGAAATAMVGRAVAYRELRDVEVRVDRPFVLLVTHRRTGAVAFAARVRDP